jgi:PKD repeat protein
MNIARFRRLLWISGLALLLAACKPSAEFSVSPTPVIAGAVATFDASETAIYNTHKGNVAVSYDWDFGDGEIGSGKLVQHTYAGAGTYSVKLSVKDKAGQIGTVTLPVVVQAGGQAQADLTVIVRGADGALIKGAIVVLGNLSATTDENGVATLNQALTGADQVVSALVTGYVPQSQQVALIPGEAAQVLELILLPIKETQTSPSIEAAQMFIARSLGASVTLPANALVNAANGQPATGAARLQLTPWDITGADLSAMPGSSQAVDALGQRINLISAGMMTVDFFDIAGNALQLANGKSAALQMDLPYTAIGDQELIEGSSIPLWYFNQQRGLWEEQGRGTVVQSSTSRTGLAVKATVSHFSTWNWDYPMYGAGSANVRCVEASGASVSCSVRYVATYANGSSGTRSTFLNGAGADVRNLPPNTTIRWTATTADGEQGVAVSGNSGTVIITIQPPTTSNFVQCAQADSTSSSCQITMEVTTSNGTQVTASYFVPASGAHIKTRVANPVSIQWNASLITSDGSGLVFRYEGRAGSDTGSPVTIVLDPSVPLPTKTLYFQCDNNAEYFSGYVGVGTPTTVAVNECNLNISQFGGLNYGLLREVSVKAPSGTLVPVTVSVIGTNDLLFISATATAVNGQSVWLRDFNGWLNGAEFAGGQTINLRFWGGDTQTPV